MTCRLCTERGKVWHGDDPVCAFDDNGVFRGENWNCATMNRLRDLAWEMKQAVRDDFEAGSFGWLRFDEGYIVMTWYKARGRTPDALVMHDGERRPLRIEDAEGAIANHERAKA